MELSILRKYQQTPNKIITNQGENKNINDIFYSLEFIHFIADLIDPLYIFHILLSNIYIYIYIYIANLYIYIYIYIDK